MTFTKATARAAQGADSSWASSAAVSYSSSNSRPRLDPRVILLAPARSRLMSLPMKSGFTTGQIHLIDGGWSN